MEKDKINKRRYDLVEKHSLEHIGLRVKFFNLFVTSKYD